MIDLDEFNRLKKKASEKKSEVDRAQGSLDEKMSKLKTDFGVESEEAGSELHGKLLLEESELETKYNNKLDEFKEKWKGKL